MTGQHSDFISKVRRATAVGSAHQDLRAADDALKLLGAKISALRETAAQSQKLINSSEAVEGVICGALLSHAVILYARATDTQPIDRFKWFGKDILSSKLRPFHEEVMRFRDRALAHFGLDPDLEDGPALSHALVLKNPKTTTHVTIAYVEARANTRTRLFEKLSELVSYLLPVADARYDKRIAEVWEAFNSSVVGRRELVEALRQSKFKTEMLGAGETDFFDDDESRELSGHHTLKKPRI